MSVGEELPNNGKYATCVLLRFLVYVGAMLPCVDGHAIEPQFRVFKANVRLWSE